MELLITLALLLIAALASFLVKQRGVIELTSMMASAIAFISSISIALKISYTGTYDVFLFSVDALSAIVMLIVSFVGLATTCYSVMYLRQEMATHIIGLTRVRQYFALLNLFLMAMFVTISASHPILTWIFIEATTLSTAFLISFYNKPSAVEAAWKYLVINSVSLLLGFFGTLLYLTAFSASGGNASVTWASLLSNTVPLHPSVAKIAFIFILIGYGTKVGFVPMHTWKPDAYSKSPAPIGALFSGALLPVALFVVFKFKTITDAVAGSAFSQTILISFGILSVATASFILWTSKNYKRLFAYSSIEHAGIVALGFGFGGLGPFAAILHMMYHSLIKPALFMLSGNILLKYHSTKIFNVKGVLTALPATGVLFLAGILAIAGAPPFGILLTKFLILAAGIAHRPVVSVITIFLFAIVFAGLFKHAGAMVFGEKPADMKTEKESPWLVVPPFILLATALGLSFYLPTFLRILIGNALKAMNV